MKNRIDSSRRKNPWDNNTKTVLQSFIENKYKENYNFKHPKLSETEEAKILNSIKINECRYRSKTQLIKRGTTKNGIQLYYCKNCNRRFTATTNTIFEKHKISISEWIEYLLDLFNYGSLTLTSKVNKNIINTSIYWLHKTFLVLQNWQDCIILKDKIYIDEMLYSVIKSNIETKNGKKLRGLSRNQYCIGVGYDGTNIIAIVEGLGKISSEKTKDIFLKHIKPNSKIIHDDEKSHNDLITKLNLVDESYKSTWLKTKKDKDNPLRPINHQYDLIRQFLNAHSGFDRNDLQNYLNLYCFMNSGHKKKLDKVNEFIEMALNMKVTLNYRDLFETKIKK